MRFLTTRSSYERDIMQAIAAAHRELYLQDQHNLAVQIANNVGKLFGGG